MRAWVLALVFAAGWAGPASADVTTYNFYTTTGDLRAFVEFASPPASATSGWNADGSAVVLWRIRVPSGGSLVWVTAFDQGGTYGSLSGPTLDSGSVPLFIPPDGTTGPFTAIDVVFSATPNQDRMSIGIAGGTTINLAGNFVAAPTPFAIPEPRPVALAGLGSAATILLANLRRRWARRATPRPGRPSR